MRKRQPPDDAFDGGDGYQDEARPAAATSSFDAAQDLLQAALDEIRGVESRDHAPPAVPEPTPGGAAAGETKPAEFWASPQPAAPRSRRSTKSSAAAVAAASGSTRTPAPTTRRGSPPPTPTDEFEGLTDTLYQAPAGGTRRRRRPEDAAAAAAIGATLAGTGVLPTEAAVPPETAAATPDIPPADTEVTDIGPTDTEADEVTDTEVTDDRRRPAVVPGPTWSNTDAADAPPSRRRTQKIVAALVAALVGIGVLAVVVSTSGGSDEPAVQAGGRARLTFAPITTPEGATVTRVWELQGKRGGEFVGTLEFANPTSAPVKATFTEVIPKSLAANVSDITFDPQPVVIKADPIVQYNLVVPAGGTFTATYRINVAPDGVDRRRLDTWARELPPQTTASTTTTTTAPTAAPTTPPAPTAAVTTPPRPTTAPTTPSTNPPPPPTTIPPPVARGTLVIQVVSYGQPSGTFGYSTPDGGISLTTPEGGGSASWSTTVDPGAYTLTQTSTPSFFYIFGISCSNGFAAGKDATTAPVTVNPGETVSCTFDNRPR